MNRKYYESLSFNNFREWNKTYDQLWINDIPIRSFTFHEIIEINNLKHYCFKVFNYTIYFIYIGDDVITKSNISNKIEREPQKFIVHREDNEPAIFNSNKEKFGFFKYGRFHRENDLPAYNTENGEYWYLHGFQYRKNAPAKTEFTYRHQEIFDFLIFDESIPEDFDLREKYEEVIINGIKHTKYTNNLNQTIYFCNNTIHREDDEPAFICNDYKIWYKNGLVHRMFKPAVIYWGNNEFYYKSGRSLTNEEIQKEKVIANVNIF